MFYSHALDRCILYSTLTNFQQFRNEVHPARVDAPCTVNACGNKYISHLYNLHSFPQADGDNQDSCTSPRLPQSFALLASIIINPCYLLCRPTPHTRDSTALSLRGLTMHTIFVTDRAAHTGPFAAHPLFTSQKHVQDVCPRIALTTNLCVNCSVDEEMTLGAGPGGDCVCA